MRRLAIAADRYIAPLLVFVFVYVATLWGLQFVRFPFVHWSALIAVTVASIATIRILDRGAWHLGLFVPPSLATREFAFGLGFGAALIGACALLVVLTTEVRHGPGRGFPWGELALVFIPAVLHEELLFRGYPFQKLVQANRTFAVVFVALIFAGLHAGNSSVTVLALVNIFLGGVLLGMAYLRYRRLWFPIGLHLAWNLMTGPILGHEVSGYRSIQSLLIESGHGPWWLSGGEFGIEGSVWMTAVELLAIALISRTMPRAAAILIALVIATGAFAQKSVTVTFDIAGMTCMMCEDNAEKALRGLAEVTRADVDLSSKKATVTATRELTHAEIRKALSKYGFDAGFEGDPLPGRLPDAEKAKLDIRLVSSGEKFDIEKSLAKGKFTIFDFFAEWCGPCHALTPKLEKLVKDDPRVALRTIDLQNWTSLAAQQATIQFRMSGLPYVRVYGPDGKFRGEVLGNDIRKIKALLK